jgi:hypothetical protein
MYIGIAEGQLIFKYQIARGYPRGLPMKAENTMDTRLLKNRAATSLLPSRRSIKDMLTRRSVRKAKNPLSGGVQSFLTGCKKMNQIYFDCCSIIF